MAKMGRSYWAIKEEQVIQEKEDWLEEEVYPVGKAKQE